MIVLSVIICTHNPRPQYLERVLIALKAQTLPLGEWELLLVDNASNEPLSEQIDLSWHPFARHVREEELGLTSARLRGIIEASADLLVFVDDDNELDSNFLAEAIDIGGAYPFLGAWGGTILPEFEVAPDPQIEPYMHRLAIRSISEPYWGNLIGEGRSEPCGAGLCVRKGVALAYRAACESESYRKFLDRRGKELTSSGDTDLIFCSLKLGLGWGNFPQLHLTHLIPAERLTKEYHLKLWQGMTTSRTVMDLHDGRACVNETPSWRKLVRWMVLYFTKGRFDADMYRYGKIGELEGKRIHQNFNLTQ